MRDARAKEAPMKTLRAMAVTAATFALLSAVPAAADTDGSKLKEATNQVERGAKATGEGIKDTAKGVGHTVSEGAKTAGDRVKEAGESAKPEAKSAWQHLKDGATSFGHSVRDFFAGLGGK